MLSRLVSATLVVVSGGQSCRARGTGGSSGGSVDAETSRITSGDDRVCGIWAVASSESVHRLPSGSPWSTKCGGISTACGLSSSVVSASKSPSLITPFSANSRLFIRGDRFGEIGDSDLEESQSACSVGAEEGT